MAITDTYKSTFRIALCIVAMATMLSACQVIGENERLLPVSMDADTTDRCYVLIDFSGFKCVNCPKAAAVAADLQGAYGNQLIVVTMHPASNPLTQGAARYDYTCDAADVYYAYMGGIATTPLPTGNIDIQNSDGYLFDFAQWPALLASRVGKETSVHLGLYASREVGGDISIRTTCFADKPQDGYIITWLIEDSVLGAQKMPDGSVNEEYMHRHMLRTAISDPWGVPVHLTQQATQYTLTYTLPEAYDPKHCSIVVAITNTDHEIINARQTPLQ